MCGCWRCGESCNELGHTPEQCIGALKGARDSAREDREMLRTALRGAVSANDDAFQVICDALSALHPPQARELMETPSYKAFAAFYKRGQ